MEKVNRIRQRRTPWNFSCRCLLTSFGRSISSIKGEPFPEAKVHPISPLQYTIAAATRPSVQLEKGAVPARSRVMGSPYATTTVGFHKGPEIVDQKFRISVAAGICFLFLLCTILGRIKYPKHGSQKWCGAKHFGRKCWF